MWGTGYREIERLTSDDYVLSRDEFDQFGEIAWKPIEATAEFVAPILHVHVKGELIRCTTEHPFFVKNWGWVAAKDLEPGDLVSSWDGQWVAVDEVFHTGIEEKVYNITVGGFHTYFVGGNEWGFSVWVHNASVILYRYGTGDGRHEMARHWSIELVPNEGVPIISHQAITSDVKLPNNKDKIDNWYKWTPKAKIEKFEVRSRESRTITISDDNFGKAYSYVLDRIKDTSESDYSFIRNSCITYVAKVLKVAGVNIPEKPRTKLELEAVLNRLIEILTKGI